MNSTVICLNIACRTKTAHDDTIEEFYKPSKIENLFINRFSIDEDAKNEILKIYQLEHRFDHFIDGELTLEEGLNLINHRIACD